METIRDIRTRLKSINSTKQITESMRLISTRKVQKARLRMLDNRPYLTQTIKVLESIARDPEVGRHAYITGHKTEKLPTLLIVISGDRGLCGGYNVNTSREAFALSKELGDTQVITIGAKCRDYFHRRQKPALQSFKGLSENPFFEDAQIIGGLALEMYDQKAIDRIYLVYTEYHSMLSQAPKSVKLLPLHEMSGVEGVNPAMGYEPGKETFLKHAVSTYICSKLYGAMLESALCEQSARITSMDTAVKNSNKIIDSLAIQYNQMRQGAITQEIAEISGGANAVGQA